MLSLLEALGNVADLPGSMVRDVAAVRNPLNQLMDPFGQSGRTSGRELIGMYGGGDDHNVLGAGLEMAMDPLALMGIGPVMRTAGKGMQALRGANLMGKAKSAATAGMDMARSGYGAAKSGLGEISGALGDVARGDKGAFVGRVLDWEDKAKTGLGKARDAFNKATKVVDHDWIPGPDDEIGAGFRRINLHDIMAAAGKVPGQIASGISKHGPTFATAVDAERAMWPSLAAGARAFGGGEDDGGDEPQVVNTPQGPMMIPGGARFSLSGQNPGQQPMQVPDWANRYRYSVAGQR